MDLNKNLRRLLVEKGMSVQGLSRRSSIPAKTLYHWMNGQRPRNIEQVHKLCQILEVTIEELCGLSMSERASERLLERKSLPLEKAFDEVHAGNFEVILRPLKKY